MMSASQPSTEGWVGAAMTDAPMQSRAGTLPTRLTSFVGRAQEIAYLTRLLQGERSVTLVGAPGVGKTSLAIQVAAALQEAYADRIWLVELAGLFDPTLVPNAVAAALGIH